MQELRRVLVAQQLTLPYDKNHNGTLVSLLDAMMLMVNM